MTVDPAYGNSSGYFKDPSNGEDLSVDTPRVIECELKDGKFIWPQVASADGNQLLKIVYRLFTDEEKALYKQYRGYDSKPRVKKEKSEEVVSHPQVSENLVEEPEEQELVKVDPGTDPEAAVTLETLQQLALSDTLYGICNIGGLYYVMCGSSKNPRKVYYIPRGLVPESEFRRLCNGE